MAVAPALVREGKSEEQNLLSEKSSSPRHRRRPLHALRSSFFLPRPRPTTTRAILPSPPKPGGSLARGTSHRVGVSLTWRSCISRSLAENGSRYVRNKIYTETSILARPRVYVLLFSVSRERAHPLGVHTCVCILYTCTCMGARVRPYTRTRCAFSAEIRDIDGVPCTRYTSSPYSRSLDAISSFNRAGTARPRSLFSSSVRAHDMYASLLPRGYKACCSETLRSADSFTRCEWISPAPAREYCESNHVFFFLVGGKSSIYLRLVQTIVLVLIYPIYLIGNIEKSSRVHNTS